MQYASGRPLLSPFPFPPYPLSLSPYYPPYPPPSPETGGDKRKTYVYERLFTRKSYVEQEAKRLTKDDTRDLWKLLELFRPGDSRLKNQSLIAAWALVLEPYSRDEVREAVAAHFRESPYWPDVTDITKRCTAPVTPPPPAKREARYQPGEAERLAGDQLSAMVRD